MITFTRSIQKAFFTPSILIAYLVLSACAHPINIAPLDTPLRNESSLIKKSVAYVITDEDRNKLVTTDGGGGDKVSYYPYRELEKSIRDSLRSIYQNVTSLRSTSDIKAIQDNNVTLIFSPELSTSSVSNSMLTWPPTQFFINLSCNVTDNEGKVITQLRVSGNGSAEFSEFKSDFGLAGRRASSDLATKLQQEMLKHSALQ